MEIFKGILPFLFMVFVAMVLFYTFPAIGLWLPGYLYN
jgi:TRAP-type mannitol/chloroaromatic compound transport system permease large subunit